MKQMHYFNLIISALFLLPSPCEAQVEPAFKTLVTIEVTNSNKEPVEGESASLLFNHILDSKSKEYQGATDPSGKFSATDWITSSLMIKVSKDGYYQIRKDSVLTRIDVDQREINLFDLPLVMRERLNPIPLKARRISRAIPILRDVVGFYLEIGD